MKKKKLSKTQQQRPAVYENHNDRYYNCCCWCSVVAAAALRLFSGCRLAAHKRKTKTRAFAIQPTPITVIFTFIFCYLRFARPISFFPNTSTAQARARTHTRQSILYVFPIFYFNATSCIRPLRAPRVSGSASPERFCCSICAHSATLNVWKLQKKSLQLFLLLFFV